MQHRSPMRIPLSAPRHRHSWSSHRRLPAASPSPRRLDLQDPVTSPPPLHPLLCNFPALPRPNGEPFLSPPFPPQIQLQFQA
ncbi:hypothetical protein SETIT_3G364600v2 [Setaria italica]|uniref:Uncharacterized protein n=1 Tax=Setaria italica TaxID=4555 RepID=A0A368QMK6_SETIT|nr:hypothetical protein SETIT_3G364600v2 [Setaria italica]